ncbi:ANTAR domain-containing response regulator [Veillonella sp. VA139]|uniref:ANTAR domain-containing response regulator n=1 Tax=Veillonella sp. VA139 TaxID=741830 RepID=UPI000F8CAA08|nr:response regulator [Veillonella sp. VA139]
MRVLVVDDESLIRMDLRDILESQGHTVVGEGANGVEAIQLCKNLAPDIVLMDVKMPELDGIEAARQIRHKRLAPVVLLTAYSQDDLIQKASQSGVYGYLIKPLREPDLGPALQMAMGRFQEERDLLEQVKGLTNSLEERKYVTKATGILMDLHRFSEEKAYEKIRAFSMDKRISILETCKKIIAAHEAKL